MTTTRQHVPFITWLIDKRTEVFARNSGAEMMICETAHRKIAATQKVAQK